MVANFVHHLQVMYIGPLNLQNSQVSTSLSSREIRSKVWEKKKGEDTPLSTGTSAAAFIITFGFCASKCRLLLWWWSSSPSTYWELQEEEAMVMHEDVLLLLLDSSAEVLREVVAQQQQQRLILKILLRVWWWSGVRLQQHLPGWWRRNRLILLSGLRKKKPKLILSFLQMLCFFSLSSVHRRAISFQSPE